MNDELRPPRESIVDLALLLEHSIEDDGSWYSGDQVLDLHLLKVRLKERQERLDRTLSKIHLQGIEVVLTPPVKAALRQDVVDLIEVSMNILQLCQLLDPEDRSKESDLPDP